MKKTLTIAMCLIALVFSVNANAKDKRSRSRDSRDYNKKLNPRPQKDASGRKDLDRNRAVNPKRVPNGNVRRVATDPSSFKFPVKRGAHLFDGQGKKRSVIASKEVKINYGQQKVMIGSDGKRHQYYYAFGTKLKNRQSASGWIRRSALKEQPKMPTVKAPRAPSGPVVKYKITGGNLRKFGDLKVHRLVPANKNLRASDYLRRPGGYVNQTYNLPGKGGVGTDTFKTGTTFYRTPSVKLRSVPLYKPDGRNVVRRMPFVYGYIKTPNSPDRRRYGWMALDALRRRPRIQ